MFGGNFNQLKSGYVPGPKNPSTGAPEVVTNLTGNLAPGGSGRLVNQNGQMPGVAQPVGNSPLPIGTKLFNGVVTPNTKYVGPGVMTAPVVGAVFGGAAQTNPKNPGVVINNAGNQTTNGFNPAGQPVNVPAGSGYVFNPALKQILSNKLQQQQAAQSAQAGSLPLYKGLDPNSVKAQQMLQMQQQAQQKAILNAQAKQTFLNNQKAQQGQVLPAGPQFTGNPEDYAAAWNQFP